jgi:hypothetical protein
MYERYDYTISHVRRIIGTLIYRMSRVVRTLEPAYNYYFWCEKQTVKLIIITPDPEYYFGGHCCPKWN